VISQAEEQIVEQSFVLLVNARARMIELTPGVSLFSLRICRAITVVSALGYMLLLSFSYNVLF
jgi:hypothetical protein